MRSLEVSMKKVDPRTVTIIKKIIQYILKVSLVDSSENIKRLIIFAYFLDDFIIRMCWKSLKNEKTLTYCDETHVIKSNQSFGKNKHSEVQKR